MNGGTEDEPPDGKEYDLAVALDPASADAHYRRAAFLSSRFYLEAGSEHDREALEAALLDYKEAARLDPAWSDAQVLGEYFVSAGRAGDALKIGDDMVTGRPESAFGHALRGRALKSMERWDDSGADSEAKRGGAASFQCP